MYRQIVVAVDGSQTSDLALDEAIRLAKDQQAQLHLVHVIESPYQYDELVGIDPEQMESALRTAGQKVLDEALARTRQEGIQANGVLIEEAAWRISEAIADEAKRQSADLIVIGTHGRHGLRHLVMGSVAEGVIHSATVPVLLVHRAK